MSEDIVRLEHLVRQITRCSSKDAAERAKEACSSPEAIALLAVACTGSKVAVVGGGMTMLVGATTRSGTALVAGSVTTLAGIAAVRRYCNALVDNGVPGVLGDDAHIRALSNPQSGK